MTVGGGLGTTHGEPDTYPAARGRRRLPEAGAAARGRRSRRDDAARLRQPLEPQARAAQVHDRPPGPRVVRRRDHAAGWACARAGAAVRVHDEATASAGSRATTARWHLTLRIESGRVADNARGRAAHGAARDREDSPRRFPHHREPEPDHRERRAVRARFIDGLVVRTGSTCTSAPRHCIEMRSPAWRYRRARWRWPRPSATCRASSSSVDDRLAKYGLREQPLLLRITGCPNGCARPYLAEIGLIGKAPGRYNLYFGGDGRGQRLNVLYRENVDEPTILAALDALFARYAAERRRRERFGDFVWRAGVVSAPGAARKGSERMRAVAWDPDRCVHEPTVIDAMNADLEQMTRRSAYVGARAPARQARVDVELRRAGGRLAAHGHAGQARCSRCAGRHGLPFPGDLPFHRRPRRASWSSTSSLPAADVAGLARGALRPALGAGHRGHRALQRPAQDRADAPCADRARREDLVRGPAP